MNMIITELQHYLVARKSKRLLVPKIACRDGWNVSVQASEHHYCQPRTNHGPYQTVEVGFPSAYEADFEPWFDTDNVYAYVPIDIVCRVLERHGGVDFTWDYYKID